MNLHKAQLEVGARSEIGYVRDENQDRMSGTRVPLGQLYIVADGMGGHKGGALAAELTVQGLQRYIGEAPVNASVEKVIQMAFNKTNETVYQQAHSGDPATEGMGSTAVLLLISGGVARVAHVGDSRAYLFRAGRLRRLTTDHTIVQKMVQAEMLKPEEAIDHPNANVLDRAIGSKPSVEVDISDILRLHEGDAILLCSDGLSGYITDSEIASVLRSPATVQEIPDRLVELSLQKGGEDNVTVQFIQYGTRHKTKFITSRIRHPLFQIVLAFILGFICGAAVSISLYSSMKGDNSKTSSGDSKTQLPQLQNPPNRNVEGINEDPKPAAQTPEEADQTTRGKSPESSETDSGPSKPQAQTNQTNQRPPPQKRR
jgi:PPM family protein phosphatase